MFLALAFLVVAVVMRVFGVEEAGVRQAEIGMHVGFTGCADRGPGAAVIPHLPPDDFAFFRLADGGMIVPD